jgi:hypothetical protein
LDAIATELDLTGRIQNAAESGRRSKAQHLTGHWRATGSFLASRLIDVVLDATANWSSERGLAEAGIDRLAVP